MGEQAGTTRSKEVNGGKLTHCKLPSSNHYIKDQINRECYEPLFVLIYDIFVLQRFLLVFPVCGFSWYMYVGCQALKQKK